jgi:hypothetical protein
MTAAWLILTVAAICLAWVAVLLRTNSSVEGRQARAEERSKASLTDSHHAPPRSIRRHGQATEGL